MLATRQQSFLDARAALPPLTAFTKDVIIISIGSERGTFSNCHIDAAGDTDHFVFIKDKRQRWLCADGILQDWHHAAAAQVLEIGNPLQNRISSLLL